MAIQMTAQEYQDKYGQAPNVPSAPAPVQMTQAQYDAKYKKPAAPAQAPGQTGLGAPAFDMAKNTSGLGGTVAKEGANFIKSGVNFAAGLVQSVNPLAVAKKVAQIPGAAGGLTNDIAAARQSEAQAAQMEAKVNAQRAAKGEAAKAPVAGPSKPGDLTPNFLKAGYETITPQAIQEAFKGHGTDALTSAANDPFQFAAIMLPFVKGLPLGETKVAGAVDTGIAKATDVAKSATEQAITKAKETYAKIPEPVKESLKYKGTGLPEKTLAERVKATDEAIKTGIDKGVKPSVVGKGTLTKRAGFYDKATAAVKNIADLRDQIKITDPTTGEAVEGPPKNVAQAAEATDQAMKLIWKKTTEVMKSAGEQGAELDTKAPINYLDKMANDLGNTPEMRAAAEGLKPAIEELDGQAPDVIARRMAQYNEDLKNYYKSGVGGDTATLKAGVMAELRAAMDKSINDVLDKPGNQDLRDQYGEMKTLDKEMQHRATVVGRAAPKGLFAGIADAGAIVELTRAIMHLDPASLASSFAIKGLAEYIKKLNSPDSNIAKMFESVYDLKDKATEAGQPSLRGYKAPKAKAPTKK